jgi:acetylglutamate kinase
VSRIVIKVGGAVATQATGVVLALADEHDVCVVHGAGRQITEELRRFGIESRFVGGRRATSPAAMGVVRSSLAAVNRALCAALGAVAEPLFGDEIGLRATPISELGLVGSPLPSRPAAVDAALAAGRIPVIAPLAVGPLNVNADEAAAALAIGLRADRLLFLSDVPGLLLGGAVAAAIRAREAARLLGEGAFDGGIVPKLRAAVEAARSGVRAQIGETAVVA